MRVDAEIMSKLLMASWEQGHSLNDHLRLSVFGMSQDSCPAEGPLDPPFQLAPCFLMSLEDPKYN